MEKTQWTLEEYLNLISLKNEKNINLLNTSITELNNINRSNNNNGKIVSLTSTYFSKVACKTYDKRVSKLVKSHKKYIKKFEQRNIKIKQPLYVYFEETFCERISCVLKDFTEALIFSQEVKDLKDFPEFYTPIYNQIAKFKNVILESQERINTYKSFDSSLIFNPQREIIANFTNDEITK